MTVEISMLPLLPQEQLSASLWINRGFGSGQFTVFGARPRALLSPRGVRAVVEQSLLSRLAARLAATPGAALAEALGVDENMISRLRNAMGIGLGHGGARRGDPHQPDEGTGDDRARVRPLALKRISVVGDGKPALIIVREGAFVLMPSTMVLIELGAEEALAEYLAECTIAAAAEACDLSPKVIVRLRKRFRDVAA